MQDKILLVEDDDILRTLYTETLVSAGFQVVAVGNYVDATTVLDEAGKSLALLMTDLIIPHSNGFALARMARSACPGLRILYLTGFDFRSEGELGKILRKPIIGDQLIREVKFALMGR